MRPKVLETADDAVYDEKYGLWLRPNTLDLYVAKEMFGYRHLEVEPGGTVLDLGSNIGASAKYFLETRGAERVICVEPEPDNYQMLLRNTAIWSKHIVYHNAAVTEDPDSHEVSFFVTEGGNKGNHTMIPIRGRKEIRVPTVDINDLLDMWKPQSVKCDIEGAEHFISHALTHLPECVKGLVIDYSMNLGKTARAQAAVLDAGILESGFEFVQGGRLDTKAWTAVRTYKRA